MFDKKSDGTGSNFETVVGPSIKIEGDFAGKGNILIQGSINGTISTDNDIKIEKGSKINANIKANSASIAGEIVGNLEIKNRLDLQSSSHITGDITAAVINIEAGSVFNGKCTIKNAEVTKQTEKK
ncbi:MAG: hypothetical protein G01um101418_293 [Parcubacteria group bacterium Gr01-1014_18]|nr:MAG: hypothetical protein Greene041636_331 [Parcubacteria group bacterium Greene0416_36]TSC81153.1 MAG: hypothetical protein G01um101418_293 [Parcubacteria group bacterium Gr01-1014_18]TSC99150.1 MAG: hypothetical protein Greene101420_295 [Parcubacteria group bacterium Greene1014_20]TSD07492.1 MAG: hypothetical protein Greene07142_191 [Parcubacteria group bacterium Greene0714_2]